MATTGAPIEFGARHTSTSPRNQHSNLTAQLQSPDASSAMDVLDDSHDDKGRQESISMFGTTPHGARQIPVGNGQRRESHALSGSFVAGMSWGGISMGSFIRDDILMTGTSPYNFQSPSFHSSSYLPKMEANYMKDYVCCDIRLDSMHELLQHYEEAHAAQPTQTMGRTPKDQQYPGRAGNAANTIQGIEQQAQSQSTSNLQVHPHAPATASPLFSGQSADQIGTFGDLDDMDMDDGVPTSQTPQAQGPNYQPQPQFGRQQPRGPAVNVNLANAFQGQGLNSATPTTPHAPQHFSGLPGFQNNPTVSSVNTPSLTSPAQTAGTPDPSQPSTPGELDPDFVAQMQNANLDYTHLPIGFDLSGSSNNNNGGSATIDNPEKRLLSKQGFGGNNNKGFPANSFNTSEIAKKVREGQLLSGLAGVGGFVGEEIKPFKCPVIGCEKAYKNQNGLKYHKQHGHQNQQLKENSDGTFSIVDPTTSIPYPGTLGMEKEKPYRCETCGKRYKNLNGLKYHRQHSPPCNPELRLTSPGGMGAHAQNLSANVAGALLNDGLGY